MKKKLLLGAVFASFLSAMPVSAEPVDSSTWLTGDYVGVGAIDVPKLAQRRIYSYLMDFFVTDKNVKQAFSIIRDAGIILEDTVTRIVVGLPHDIDKSEHIVIWETGEDLSKYKEILDKYSSRIDKRVHNGIHYYATKRENECLTIFGSVLVLGSELKIQSMIDAHNSKFKNSTQNPVLAAEIKRVNKSHDAWLAFALNASERAVLGRGDPILDLTKEGRGALRLGDVHSGSLTLDFTKGLKAQSTFMMTDNPAAASAASVLTASVDSARANEDIKALEFDDFLKGLAFTADKKDVTMTIDYSQATFDNLIAFFTQFIKSLPGQPDSKGNLNPIDAAPSKEIPAEKPSDSAKPAPDIPAAPAAK